MSIPCKLEVPNTPGLKENELTVGRTFIIKCEGDFPTLNAEAMTIPIPENFKYVLKIFSFEFRDLKTLEITATSYTAGQVKIDGWEIVQGEVKVPLDPLEFSVTSVIKDPQQKPYGPYGPFELGVPHELWIAAAVALAAILFFLGSILLKSLRVTRERKLLKKLEVGASPAFHAYQQLREIRRQCVNQDPVKVSDLKNILLGYLSRKYSVYLVGRRKKQLFRFFRKKARKEFEFWEKDLGWVLSEIDRLENRKTKSDIKEEDIIQLTDATQALIEKIDSRRRV